MDIWDEFGSWCLIHGVEDPWKLPSYRFGALLVFYMKIDKVEESLTVIDDTLVDTDNKPHPFYDPDFIRISKAMCQALYPTKSRTTMDNVIYDPRLIDELPVEERKMLEAREAGKAFRVPEWWRGEKANYKIAQSMMISLPKKMGPVKE